MNSNLVIFDFDDTLFRGQSFDEFIRFIYENERNIVRKLLYKLSKVVIRYTHFSSEINKFLLTRFMVGMPMKVILSRAEEFEIATIEKNIITPVYHCLQNHLRQGDTVILISGGLEIYIKIFAKKHNIPYSIATKIIDNNHCFVSVGQECLGNNKLERLSMELEINKYNKENVHVYSDHVSDLPLLEHFGKPHFVAQARASIPDIIIQKKWDIILYE